MREKALDVSKRPKPGKQFQNGGVVKLPQTILLQLFFSAHETLYSKT